MSYSRHKNNVTTFILILVLIIFTSCSTNDDTPNFTDASKLRLKLYTSYTSVNPDFVFKNEFHYDNENRLVNIQSNILGSTIDFKYDDKGRLIQVGDYVYYYNSDDKVYKIKNNNLLVASGKYDSTMVSYNTGKIASNLESFTGDYSKKRNITNITYNNKEQIRLAIRTSTIFINETGQEFVDQKDRETLYYDANGNLQKIISEQDYDSNDLLTIEKTYSFDDYKNPVQLVKKSTGINENISMIYLNNIAYKNSFYVGATFNYFQNNEVSSTSIPQTSDDSYVQYSSKTSYTYNKYGYPIGAEETQTLLNRDLEFTNFTSWEYEEY